MEPCELARTTTERGEIVLRRRVENGVPVVELRVNGVFVMDTRETTSEEELARRALAATASAARVLVGGLGLGFTAHALLGDRRVERVDVVEIEQPLIDWMRDGTIPHGPSLLADQRLRVVAADIRQAVRETTAATYDLVLLDVDNGPGYLVHDANAAVYRSEFLGEVARVVRPGGLIAVWSADPAPELLESLSKVATTEETSFPVDLQGRSEHYYVYFARV